jgi:hypothetical protein
MFSGVCPSHSDGVTVSPRMTSTCQNPFSLWTADSQRNDSERSKANTQTSELDVLGGTSQLPIDSSNHRQPLTGALVFW